MKKKNSRQSNQIYYCSPQQDLTKDHLIHHISKYMRATLLSVQCDSVRKCLYLQHRVYLCLFFIYCSVMNGFDDEYGNNENKPENNVAVHGKNS